MYAEATGDELDSEEFYRRYRAGEFDDPFSMAWATYFEAFDRLSEDRRPELAALEDALPPVAVA